MSSRSLQILFLLLVTVFTLELSSCKTRPGTPAHLEDVDMTGMEYTSAFICPMHCAGSGADAAGTCPVCGMDYVPNKNYVAPSEANDSVSVADTSATD